MNTIVCRSRVTCHVPLTFCFLEDLLKVEGMDMKVSEPITAAHLINAAKLGNSKADAVLNKGQITKQTHTHDVLFMNFKQMGCLVIIR